MCKLQNNCTNSNGFWWLSEKDLVTYRIGNLNSQLVEVIGFKQYGRRIGQNSSRSITRVKRIYRIFYYRKVVLSLLTWKFFWSSNVSSSSNKRKIRTHFQNNVVHNHWKRERAQIVVTFVQFIFDFNLLSNLKSFWRSIDF